MTLILKQFKSCTGVLPIFSDEELRRLTMPTLLLMGVADPMRDAKKIVARMQRLLPHLTAAVIPGAGHVPLYTTSRIVPFLAHENGA